MAAIKTYVGEYPYQTDLVLGANVETPIRSEGQLRRAIEEVDSLTRTDIATCCQKLAEADLDAYPLVFFAVRMAIHAARVNQTRLLETGLFGMMIDQGVDWRDVLGFLSIIDNCASRIGFDFDAAIRERSKLASDRRRNVIEGYLSRSPTERAIGVFGFVALGSGSTLRFEKGLL